MKSNFILSLMFGAAVLGSEQGFCSPYELVPYNEEDGRMIKDRRWFNSTCLKPAELGHKILEVTSRMDALKEEIDGLVSNCNDDSSSLSNNIVREHEKEFKNLLVEKRKLVSSFNDIVRCLVEKVSSVLDYSGTMRPQARLFFCYSTLESVVKSGSIRLLSRYKSHCDVKKIISYHNEKHIDENCDNVFHTLCNNVSELSPNMLVTFMNILGKDELKQMLEKLGTEGKTPLQLINDTIEREKADFNGMGKDEIIKELIKRSKDGDFNFRKVKTLMDIKEKIENFLDKGEIPTDNNLENTINKYGFDLFDPVKDLFEYI